MIVQIIKIRFYQLYRAIKSLGIIRTIILLGIVGFTMFYVFLQTQNQPNSYIITALYELSIFYIHLKRKDKFFLKTQIKNFKAVLITEYILLSLPIIVFLSVNLQLIAIIETLALILITININFSIKRKNLNTKLQKLIPDKSFEWKAGIRRTFVLTLIIWTIGFTTSFYIGSVPITIFILGIIPISFYESCESLEILMAEQKNAKEFIAIKIKLQFKIFSILILPLIIAFLIFHYEYWYIVLFEFIMFSIIHFYYIVVKYSFYWPNEKNSASQVISTLGVLGMIVPFLAPVLIIFSVFLYFKAINNLKFYLDDFN